MVENYYISIGPFINPLNYFKNLKSSLFTRLSTKYHNETKVVLNITKFFVCF